MQESLATTSHVAYADETHYNIGRYRGVALITLSQKHVVDAKAELHHLLAESEVAEFKWKRLDNAKRRFAAIKMVQWTIRKCLEGVLRVDVLTWDAEDKRHKVWRRDDIANLQRMYYHLFKNVLCERWPDGSTWRLCPDENTAMT